MKCEACLNLLEEYADGELLEHDAAPVSAHLITCSSCANEFDSLGAEQEIYARYDRGLSISPSVWSAVEASIVPASVAADSSRRASGWLAGLFVPRAFGFSFAGAMAVLVLAAVIGVAYLRVHQQRAPTVKGNIIASIPTPQVSGGAAPAGGSETPRPAIGPNHGPVKKNSRSGLASIGKRDPAGQSDVLASDVASLDIEDRDTQRHIEQAQNLLRSVRNLQPADGDDDVDVSYEKALSRRLLNENIILRRDAEMSGRFPAKVMLGDLEPFLIDIANLPDQAAREDLRVIRERVKSTEIVAALQGY